MDRVLDLGGRDDCVYGYLTLLELAALSQACRILNPRITAYLREPREKRQPAIEHAFQRATERHHRLPKFRGTLMSVGSVLDHYLSITPASIRKNMSEHFRKRRSVHVRIVAVFVFEVIRAGLVRRSYLEYRLHDYLEEIRDLWTREMVKTTEDLYVVSPFLDPLTIRQVRFDLHFSACLRGHVCAGQCLESYPLALCSE